jgi:transcription-repair coupling factor (superfamily II helicase)
MGDRIESIRFFDPSIRGLARHLRGTRRSCHTLIPDEESLEQGLQRLLNSCEERGVEKRVRQRLVDDFKHRVRFPGAECYLPYFFPNLQSLLDYIPPDSVLVLPDADTLGHTFEDLQEEIFRGWESASGKGFLSLARRTALSG